MNRIVIANLNSQDEKILFHDLSPAEIETVSGGSGGSVNNYFITTNTGDPTNGISNSTDINSIHDNKIGTIDFSRSTYIVINSW